MAVSLIGKRGIYLDNRLNGYIAWRYTCQDCTVVANTVTNAVVQTKAVIKQQSIEYNPKFYAAFSM